MDDPSAAALWTAKLGQWADVAIGRPVRLAADLGQAYFFDPETGDAIAENRAADPAPALPKATAHA